MQRENKIILVTGATGKQGGAAARHLLGRGWNVRAMTRDPQKPSAKELEDLGATIVQGDFRDTRSLADAMHGAYGVFSVQDFWQSGAEGEILEGKNVVDEAKAAGIEHLVYTSVGGAERDSGLPHFESKWEIEQYIRLQEIPATILRPVFFMENFSSPQMQPSILHGSFSLPMKPNKPLQMIAVDDIGAFAAMAFDQPEQFIDKQIELAGDELTMPQAMREFGKVLGHEVRFTEMPLEDMRKSSEEYALMFDWFNRFGYQADIPALREMHPQLMSLANWLRKSNWAQSAQKQEAHAGAR